MHDLTPRQIDILKHIIREYIDSAEAVGSETLEKKYDLGVSPATIRNEMLDMEKLGYLIKPHSSSGRIPTSRALKLYVAELMKEKQLSVAEEVEAKEQVWDTRSHEDVCLHELTKSLASKTKTLAVATSDRGSVYYAGYANLFDMPEFYDFDVTRNLFSIIDEYSSIHQILTRMQSDFGILFGDEMEMEMYRPYSFIFSRFITPSSHTGTIGVIGPTRLKYEDVVPAVKYYANLIQEIGNW